MALETKRLKKAGYLKTSKEVFLRLIKMASSKITLAIPEPILKELKKDKNKFSYTSLQQVIIDVLRDKYMRDLSKEGKRGRPRKFDEMKFLTAKKIFDKKGGIIPI